MIFFLFQVGLKKKNIQLSVLTEERGEEIERPAMAGKQRDWGDM